MMTLGFSLIQQRPRLTVVNLTMGSFLTTWAIGWGGCRAYKYVKNEMIRDQARKFNIDRRAKFETTIETINSQRAEEGRPLLEIKPIKLKVDLDSNETS